MIRTLGGFIEEDEGRRLKVYPCPSGKLTAGVGRNLEEKGLTHAETAFMRANDEASGRVFRGSEVEYLLIHVQPDGKRVIGWGRDMDADGISHQECNMWLKDDVFEVTEDLLGIFPSMVFENDSGPREFAIFSTRFQLGYRSFRGFIKMISAIRMKQWSRAADEALDSDWAREDTPERAAKMAQMLRSGEWPE